MAERFTYFTEEKFPLTIPDASPEDLLKDNLGLDSVAFRKETENDASTAYEEYRQDVDNAQFNLSVAQAESAYRQYGLESDLFSEEEIPPTISPGEEWETPKIGRVDFGRPMINYDAPMEASEEELANQEKRRESTSVWGHTGEILEFIASPFMAIGDAVLAPIAHDFEETDLFSRIGESFSVSGNAFLDRIAPTYGKKYEHFARKIIEDIMPENTPQPIKDFMTATLDLLSDPTIPVSAGFMTVVRQGLKVSRNARIAKGQIATVGNMIEDGVMEVLTFGKQVRPDIRFDKTAKAKIEIDIRHQNIIQLAKVVDKTKDPKDLAKLQEALAEDDTIQAGINMINEKEVFDEVGRFNEILGDPNGELLEIVPPRQKMTKKEILELKEKNLFSNDKNAPDLKMNIARVEGEEDVITLLENAMRKHTKDFEDFTKVETNEVTKQKSQQQLLTDLLGRPVTAFEPSHAYAIRQVLVDSAFELTRLADRVKLGGLVDSLAFERAYAVHRLIQAKATGVRSHAGRLLQSYRMVNKAGRGRIAEITRITNQLC